MTEKVRLSDLQPFDAAEHLPDELVAEVAHPD